MLNELRVRDLAVIQDVTLPLGPGLNVLTGETGAGKSMLVDALALLVGERASGDLIRPGAERAVVEAGFDLNRLPQVAAAVSQAGIDIEEDRLVVRRDINAEGRNRAWANGSPTTVATLATLGRNLVDLHGQHESQSLLRRGAQRDILDAFGSAAAELAAVRAAYERAAALRAEEVELIARRDDVKRRADYLEHVAREIAEARPRPGEYEELEVESHRLSNVEDITSDAERLLALLDGDDLSALGSLGKVTKVLTHLERIDASVAKWRDLVDDAHANIEELTQLLREYVSEIDRDPGRLAQVEQRRDVLYRLKQKYGPEIEDVISTGEQARHELELLDTADLDIERISEARLVADRELDEAARRLSGKRAGAAARLERAVNDLLPGLGMENGRFAVRIEATETASATGIDRVEFLVTLNVGMDPRPLAHVASGGELSRLMLALKVVLAHHDAIPTLVFDEVDQGIGGAVAIKVSEALARVAESRQVLIITHLPQIAARAAHHLHVDKPVRGGLPSTAVRVLKPQERVTEVARMLGDAGDPTALRHAAEMLQRGSGGESGAGDAGKSGRVGARSAASRG
ncbi:MAG: DNA repair protein RecN [Gemmatimonadota bacterium]|nr:MAG: DNA repair protein RecN [Gemmatimonadota bacterium]